MDENLQEGSSRMKDKEKSKGSTRTVTKKQKIKDRVEVKEAGTSLESVESPKKDRKEKKKEKDSADEARVSKKEKSGKKRKRDAEEQIVHTSAPVANEETDSRPKKKSKNKTGLLDPSEDSLLSEQARKALEYAFMQFRHPKRWKFHKARQNWIIRNIWSPENIPEPQMPLVLRYLANVQGGTRENLVKACQKILEPTDDIQEKVTDPDSSAEAQAGSEKKEAATNSGTMKRARATAVLEVLSTQAEES